MEKKEKNKNEENENKKTENKKMVEVDFVGTELLNNEIFDTTIENVAKENNIYNKEKDYGPMTIILGEKELHAKVEDEIKQMKQGEEKNIHLEEKEAFGERKGEYVRVIPIKVFKEQKINPVPGLIINAGNMLGKVQSVSGGRVRVDFNHPLAGRQIEYKIKLLKEIKEPKEKCERIFKKYFSKIPEAKKEIKNENLYISVSSDTLKNIGRITESIKKLGKEIGINVEFKQIDKIEEKKESKDKKDSTEKKGANKEKI